MADLIEVVGLDSALADAGIEYSDSDFELVYSDLMSSAGHPDLVQLIEEAVFAYFSDLQLPEKPTLYDHLVRSLRRKDVIATFNWDPFLVQALDRHPDEADWPNIAFLHGNTAIGFCDNHSPLIVGTKGQNCWECDAPFRPSRLLYPIAEKDYAADPLLVDHWRGIQRAMAEAYVFTVFGYSAPDTDVEAVRLLKEGWGEPAQRNLEEVEIIDVRDSDELVAAWEPFILEHHRRVTDDYYRSLIGQHPRRSCEALWDTTMEITPRIPTPIPREAGWEELDDWYWSLREQED